MQVYDQGKAALRDVLLRVDAGAYRGEVLIGYVGLGAYSLCVFAPALLFRLHVHIALGLCCGFSTEGFAASFQVVYGAASAACAHVELGAELAGALAATEELQRPVGQGRAPSAFLRSDGLCVWSGAFEPTPLGNPLHAYSRLVRGLLRT